MKNEMLKNACFGTIGGLLGGCVYLGVKKFNDKKAYNECKEIEAQLHRILGKEIAKTLFKLFELKELESTVEVQEEMKQNLDYIELLIYKTID